jgi:divalent metal cation (Fe/Co/Zn/Cd) transporter
MPPPPNPLLRTAIQLSIASVAWGTVTGIAAIVVALASRSLALAGYGLDASIDAAASAVLIWRFSVEGRAPHRAQEVERWAHRAIGIALLAAGLYVGFEAGAALATDKAGPHHSSAAVALSVASVLALPPLAYAKYRTARRLGSRALRSDSVLTGIAALLAAFALIGILAARLFGIGWGDTAAALVIALILLREAWDALRAR